MSPTSTQIPHFVDTGTSKQLVVHGKPFLMLAAELQNSSMTCAEYMDSRWQAMKDIGVNTLFGCVTWEQIEPVEDQFDFSELDRVILGARKHGLHLILLWFGSYKNGISAYVPPWVKTDPKRFPRAKLRKDGGVLETANVLSLFHTEGRKANAKAFSKLVAHVLEIDEAHSTVLMMQVENEVGLLGDSRDGSDAANRKFAEPVPEELLSFLRGDWDALHPDLQQNLAFFKGARSPSSPAVEDQSWEAVFGRGPKTDELFMAYHYAKYLDDVAAAGKAAYPLPHYTNVWQSFVGEDADNLFPTVAGGGGAPGDYPSGGGVSCVLDIWQRFAPHLDLIAPDIYLSDYERTCQKYRHRNQPLLTPEQRRDAYGARRAWVALGSYGALAASPFGIDTLDAETCDYTEHFALLRSVSAHILAAQRRPGSSVGFCFDELPAADSGLPDPAKPMVRRFGDFEITVEPCFVFGRRDAGCGMVIHRGGGRFLLVGWGFHVQARAVSRKSHFTGILRFEEKEVVDVETGELRTLRWLNGDETRNHRFAMMPSKDPDYGGFPIAVTIPAGTMIAEVEFYSLEDELQ